MSKSYEHYRSMSSIGNELTWLTGWKSIAAALDLSPTTAKRWAKRFRMPYKRGPTGKPEITVGELWKWRCGLATKNIEKGRLILTRK